MIHLAKSPHAAVFTTWCGLAERVSRKRQPLRGPRVARDGNEIAPCDAFDCPVCLRGVEDMARRCAGILGAFPVERPAFPGCGDNSCVVRFPLGGVGTNGGCRCDESVLLLGALTLRRYALALEARLGGAS